MTHRASHSQSRHPTPAAAEQPALSCSTLPLAQQLLLDSLEAERQWRRSNWKYLPAGLLLAAGAFLAGAAWHQQASSAVAAAAAAAGSASLAGSSSGGGGGGSSGAWR